MTDLEQLKTRVDQLEKQLDQLRRTHTERVVIIRERERIIPVTQPYPYQPPTYGGPPSDRFGDNYFTGG